MVGWASVMPRSSGDAWVAPAVLALCLLCLAGPVAAAEDAAAAAAAVTHLRDIFQHVTAAIDAFAAGNAELIAVGRRTAVTLFGVLLVWGLVKSWILGKGMAQLLPEFIQPVIILGLAFWSVEHLGPTVKASVDALGLVFSGTLFQANGPPTEADILDRMAAASFEIVTATPTQGGSWVNVPSLVAHEAVGFLYRLVAAIVLMLAGVIAAGVMMIAKVQTALAILFAPVMIPWAMWQPSAFLFNAWLSFLVGGAMQGVMALAIASLSSRVVDQVVGVARSMGTNDGMSFVTCCVVLLMALLIAFLFLKVPSLASGLVGGATTNLDGWRAVSHGVGQGASALGQGAKSAGGAAYQFGKGAWQGFGRMPAGAAGAPGATASGRAPPAPPSAPRASGMAGGLGYGAGRLAGAAARSVRGDPAPAYPSAAPPVAGPASSKPQHKPFRPKPGTRPVNRPVDRAP
jgi:hypothetical protein